MSFTVTMPQLGETVTEGTILRWLKRPGESVAEDDVLLEISTDKVDTEVPSPFAGTLLQILVPEGETVDVGTALAVIGEPGEATPEPPATPVEAEEVEAPPPPATPPPLPTGDEPSLTVEVEPQSEPEPEPLPVPDPQLPPEPAVPASDGADVGVLSPVVRRLAAEHGVDLAMVSGSGRGGRITRRDVEAFVAAAAEPAPAPAAEPTPEPVGRKTGLGRGITDLLSAPGEPPAGIVTPPPAVEERATPAAEEVAVPAAAEGGARVEELDRLRQRIASNLVDSKHTAAHAWTSVEVDYEHVERVRQRHREAFKEREGMSLTYLPFIARATVDALAAFPVVNSSFDMEAGTRTFHGQAHLGIGVDLDQRGLVVMTLRGADGLRLRGIAREVKRLADKARGGNLEPDDLAGSTFTITNAGPFGSHMSVPIINLPNVAILSTDGIKKRPVVVSDDDGTDAIAIHHVGILGLSWDHRAFDGSTAVLFLRRIQENLETWDWEQELA